MLSLKRVELSVGLVCPNCTLPSSSSSSFFSFSLSLHSSLAWPRPASSTSTQRPSPQDPWTKFYLRASPGLEFYVFVVKGPGGKKQD
ncbi:hypothetical protein E2C01_101251 [Portunus trituberculatus]|uniref:Uncharacterized protein n=1 Tax=Portunus trituberculatus TaxID=210409 RepID=A0A5B7KFC9_PORTR|nr:hypothetical protein [Portunus trituberculatus]